MSLGLGLGLGLTARGGGRARPAAPTIAYVTPITNPPSFDIGLDVVSDAPKAVAAGDFIELWIDDALDATSSALTSTDITNASITIDNGTLSAGDHDAKARVKRSDGAGGYIYSAFSSAVTGTVPAASLFSDDFSTDTSADYPTTNASVAVVSGALQITNTGAFVGLIDRTLTGLLTVGESYTFSWDGVSGTITTLLGTSANGTAYLNQVNVSPHSGSVTFTASSTELRIRFRNQSATTGASISVDNLLLV